MRAKIAVLVSGNGTNLQAMIDAQQAGKLPADIAVVVSTRADAFALERARRAAIPAHVLLRQQYSDNASYSQAMLQLLAPYEIDLVLLAGFMSVLSDDFIAHYEGRIMNTHPSLIPAFCGPGYYGQHVHKAVLDYGVKVSGATIIFVDRGVDTGPIILQEAVPVLDDDDVESLSARVLAVEHRLYVQAVQLYLAGRLQLRGRRVCILPSEGGDGNNG